MSNARNDHSGLFVLSSCLNHDCHIYTRTPQPSQQTLSGYKLIISSTYRRLSQRLHWVNQGHRFSFRLVHIPTPFANQITIGFKTPRCNVRIYTFKMDVHLRQQLAVCSRKK
jgi:hypothetical protein